MINLVLALVTFALLVKLNEIIGLNLGFKVDKEKLKGVGDIEVEESEIREITDQENLVKALGILGVKLDLNDFLNKAKQAFEIIFKAYAEADKPTLKNLLAPKPYKAFSLAINDREKNHEVLEGSILNFAEVTLIDTDVKKDDVFVTVKFVTDQTVTLKAADGTILEGNPDYVETHTDVWVFSKKIDSVDPRWFLYEIKNVDQ